MLRFLIFFLVVLVFTQCDFPDKNSLTIAIEQFPKAFDPTQNIGMDERQINSQIYEMLLQLDADHQTLLPQLAQKWQVSSDERKFTFYLRDNVFFHDGTKLSALSVKNSIEWFYERDFHALKRTQIEGINILDSLILEIKLTHPNAAFLYKMTSPVGLQVISENALLKYGDDIIRHPVGTGPYQISAWKEGQEIRMKPFQNYWDKRPKAPSVIFRYIAGQSEREKALIRDEVDILYTVSGYSIDRLKWLGKIDYHVQVEHNLLFLGFNNTRYPFNDVRARRAVLRAINIPKLVLNVNRGNAEIAKGPLSAAYLNYDNFEQAGYNPDEARRLWRSVVKDSLIRVNFDFPGVAFARPILINILEEELGRIGIALNVRIYDTWKKFDEAISLDDTQLFINGGSADFLGDAENFLNDLFSTASDFNTLHYHNEQIEQWLQQSRSESDPEARRRLYEKIVRQVLDDTPAVFLYHVIPHFAYNVEKIKSMVVDPYGIIRFHKMELK